MEKYKEFSNTLQKDIQGIVDLLNINHDKLFKCGKSIFEGPQEGALYKQGYNDCVIDVATLINSQLMERLIYIKENNLT